MKIYCLLITLLSGCHSMPNQKQWQQERLGGFLLSLPSDAKINHAGLDSSYGVIKYRSKDLLKFQTGYFSEHIPSSSSGTILERDSTDKFYRTLIKDSLSGRYSLTLFAIDYSHSSDLFESGKLVRGLSLYTEDLSNKDEKMVLHIFNSVSMDHK